MDDRGYHQALPAPPPPWRMVGECVLGWVRTPRAARALLPAGVSPLPGPSALVAVSYSDSPVGPYLELSLGLPARIGIRPGLCVVLQVLSEPDAGRAYRTNWGLPATIGPLVWRAEGEDRVMGCEALGIEIRGKPVGPRFPAIVPIRSLQSRDHRPLVLPRRFVALVRLARTVVSLTEQEDRGGHLDEGAHMVRDLAGAHPGAVMSGVRIVARPVRQPAGLWSSLRAPFPGIEPAMSCLQPGGRGRGGGH
jgi:hypothetical protein